MKQELMFPFLKTRKSRKYFFLFEHLSRLTLLQPQTFIFEQKSCFFQRENNIAMVKKGCCICRTETFLVCQQRHKTTEPVVQQTIKKPLQLSKICFKYPLLRHEIALEMMGIVFTRKQSEGKEWAPAESAWEAVCSCGGPGLQGHLCTVIIVSTHRAGSTQTQLIYINALTNTRLSPTPWCVQGLVI